MKLVPTRAILFLDNLLVANHKPGQFSVDYACAYGAEKAIFPSSYFGTPKLLKFDELEVYAPTEYEKILQSLYGNYMELPPIEKRGLHHKINRFERNNLQSN